MEAPSIANSLANTIIYLRPLTAQAAAALDFDDNINYVQPLSPPPGATSVGPYASCRRVLRLGYDSAGKVPSRGFVFGCSSDADVRMPYAEEFYPEETDFFRIHYNFRSGALLITAMDQMRIGFAFFVEQESLVAMVDTTIECGGADFRYAIEFPDLRALDVSKDHQSNYQQHVELIGFPGAPYLATAHNEKLPSIGDTYSSKKILGTGTYGEVHKAVHNSNGEVFAIKKLYMPVTGASRDPTEEVKIMRKLKHANIIEYKDDFYFRGQLYIVMELAANDLRVHLAARGNSLRLNSVHSISRQSLLAVEYLHSQNIMHRDLKLANMLVTNWDPVTEIPTIKIADFGAAGQNLLHASLHGTENYIPPEVPWVLHNNAEAKRKFGVAEGPRFGYANAVDIWTLGKILWELLGMADAKPVPVEAKRLINEMMQTSPKDRPTASQCLQNPWVAYLGNTSVLAQKRTVSPPQASGSAQPYKRVLQHSASNPYTTSGRSLSGDDFALSSAEGHISSKSPKINSKFPESSKLRRRRNP